MRGARGIGPFKTRRLASRWTGIATLAMLAIIAVSWLPFRGAAVGAPLYPDLRTLPPSSLNLEHGEDGRYRLRFDNTVGNYGGRLEITVDANRNIFQNVYDKNVGGSRAIRKKVTSDLIFHPQHNHFHFANFARFELLKRDDQGLYAVARRGSKTTFCILDLLRLTSSGPTIPQYGTCGATIQGLSAGWGDTYNQQLADQAIELGRSKLADGQYAIRSTADPDNLLLETDDTNNAATTYFTVKDGVVVETGAPPLCSATPDRGPVGTTLQLTCTNFGASETVDIYWVTTTTPITNVRSTSAGAVTATLVGPNSDIGNHYVIARGRTSHRQAAALFNTIPSLTLSPTRGIVGTSLRISLRGFSSREPIEITYQPATGRSIVVATLSATSVGSATVTFTIPNSVYGPRSVKAVGQSSKASASATFSVTTSMVVVPSSVPAGGSFGLSIRGFGAREKVNVTLATDGTLLGTAATNNVGSLAVSEASFTVPPTLAPGTYQIVVTGATTGARDRATLRVTAAVTAAEEPPAPTPAATQTAVPTATPSPFPTDAPLSTPEPTATLAPTTEPTVVEAAPTATATATDQPAPSPAPTETPIPDPEGEASPQPD